MNIVDSLRKWSELTPEDAIIDWDKNVRVSFSELLTRAEASQMVFLYQVSRKATESLFYQPIDQNILRFTMRVR